MASAKEMREKLLDLGVDEEVVASLKGQALKNMYNEKLKEDFSSILGDSEGYTDDEDIDVPETFEQKIGIKYGSEEWTPWVLNQLNDNEMYKGYPKVTGLRRVLESVATVLNCATKNFHISPDGKVTVLYEIAVYWNLNTPVGFIGDAMISDDIPQNYSGLADCEYDSNDMFGRHAAASAESKAYARALKNALALSVTTYEETAATNVAQNERIREVPSTAPATSVQINMARIKLRQNSIAEEKAVKEFGLDKSLETYTYSEIQDFLSFINKYQNTD